MDLIIKQIKVAEEQLVDAHVPMDIELIDNLLHPDDAIIQPRGIFETKEQVLDPYRSRLRYWEFARSDQMDIHAYGDAEIAIGWWQANGRNGGMDFDYVVRFLSVWIRQAGLWQNLTSRSTEIS